MQDRPNSKTVSVVQGPTGAYDRILSNLRQSARKLPPPEREAMELRISMIEAEREAAGLPPLQGDRRTDSSSDGNPYYAQ